jgi:hypothetical protein
MRIPKNAKPMTVVGMLLLVAAIYALDRWKAADGKKPEPAPNSGGKPLAGDAAIEGAIREKRSGVVVETAGTVVKLLPDDRVGSRHQRFLLELASGHTVLVAHNIDLAPKIPLREGGRIRIRGQFEWNAKGGVLHWTHHDPNGRRPGGWIDWEGQRYR